MFNYIPIIHPHWLSNNEKRIERHSVDMYYMTSVIENIIDFRPGKQNGSFLASQKVSLVNLVFIWLSLINSFVVQVYVKGSCTHVVSTAWAMLGLIHAGQV
jgi:hypothetical protein